MKKEKINKSNENKSKIKKAKNNSSMKKIKILTMVLAIVLVSMIGFVGIYKQNKNIMVNAVKDYSLARDLNGSRNIKLKVSTDTTKVIKDKDGNVVENATDEEIEQNGYTTEEVPKNSSEVLTEENYNNVKRIIEKRFKNLNVDDYSINLNEETGEFNIQIPENSSADTIIGYLTTVGKFEISDNDTKEVLLDNSHIKSSDVLYNNTSTGTSVYLEIEFNKEGKNKLEEISRTYVKSSTDTNSTTDSATEENQDAENDVNSTSESSETETTTEKKIKMEIDDEEIMSTSFDEPITTGKIQLSIGSATTDSSKLQDYIKQAQNVAVVLDSGNLPIKYSIDKNEYILSDITKQDIQYVVIALLVIAFIAMVILVIKFKTNGLIAAISYVGLAALYLILVRYTNSIISIESLFAMLIILILNYIFTFILLNNVRSMKCKNKENIINKATIETYKKFFMRVIPICIMVIVFCFIKWVPISSFGMVGFWGLALIAVYNALVTRNLLKIKTDNK